METITINSVEKKASKTNVPFWAVKYNGSESATIWDETIGGYISQKIGQNVSVEITSKGNYNNIRGCNMTGGNQPMGLEMSDTQMPPIEETQQPKGSVHSVRDNTIIAQVILKGAVELTKERRFGVKDDLGPYLCMCVEELVGAYKLAYENLQV